MNKRMTFAASLAAMTALTTAPAAGQRRNAAPVSIVASVGHSEWCQSGTVRLDLRTGRYTVRAPATWRACRRPVWRTAISTSVIASEDLWEVQAAWRRAEREGLADPACGRAGPGQRIVISNGGTPILRVTRRSGTIAPPKEEGCWSEAALQLHRNLRDLFDPRGR